MEKLQKKQGMRPQIVIFIGFMGFLSLNVSTLLGQQPVIPFKSPAKKMTEQFVNEKINASYFNHLTGYYKKDSTRIDTLIVNVKSKTIELHLDPKFAYAPIRESTVDSLLGHFRNYLGESYQDFKISIHSDQKNINEYIPNYYRSRKKWYDKKRLPQSKPYQGEPLVKNLSKPTPQPPILATTHLALWHSHGYYYEQKLDRWEWQRARLFQTVEDISTLSYMLKVLVPMLENAGANVMIPRERDWQTQEVIVDNNGNLNNSIYRTNATVVKEEKGFAIGNPPYVKENPFELGTYIEFKTDKEGEQQVEWIPNIPEEGYYPVYVSYHHSATNTDKATYTVHHTGGKTVYQVNQQMGGETWIYLGRFKFHQGMNEQTGKVVLTSQSKKRGQKITADAVRFGGGMGNISRNGMVSQKPRYQEAARYYLQYAGIPDTLVWKLSNGKNDDYTDDYQSRGEWVNYLMGAPSGPKKAKNHPGLGIPIELSLALHTDAGVAHNDSVIGSLGIYSTKVDSTSYPNGISKMASRDLTDLIQTQLVNDLRQKYDTSWTRRGMWDKPYSEAFRPNVPNMLLELFSHQNFMDVRFGQDPQFRFDASRAIYKGILKYLSFQNGFKFIVQPLPVSHFQVTLAPFNSAILQWKPVTDTLEETAVPEGYIIYQRMDDGDFNNGTFVKEPMIQIQNMEPGVIYSFKVTAWNKGGESFPSEILSACHTSGATDTILIINGFDRLATPGVIDDEKYAGFMNPVDEGVEYLMSLQTTGAQFEFHRDKNWLDDDSPGHGASGAEMEGKIIPGNSFDFTYIHGKAIQRARYAFTSTSDEAVADTLVQLADYPVVDFLAGEEKTTYLPKDSIHGRFQVFTKPFLLNLERFLKAGGNLLISGSYIGTDTRIQNQDSMVGVLLKYKWRTDHASRLGNVYFCDSVFRYSTDGFQFNTQFHPTIYAAEAPDAIVPFDTTSATFMRYAENNMSAGVIYSGSYKVIALGFPFETILNSPHRDALMKTMLEFLIRKK
jgi:hypothetical protein